MDVSAVSRRNSSQFTVHRFELLTRLRNECISACNNEDEGDGEDVIVFDVTFVDDEAVVIIASVPKSLIEKKQKQRCKASCVFLHTMTCQLTGLRVRLKLSSTLGVKVLREVKKTC